MSQAFLALGLQPAIVRALDESGYTTPTPIQTQAIPPVLEGRDLLAAAQTGTGKTAGFTLPLLQRLSQHDFAKSNAKAKIRVLILTPTRELAAQVEESVRTYGKYLDIRSLVIFGGVNINPQKEKLNRRVDILVATPGRLLDLHGQRAVDLSGVETLVLDEADRMLDMGFIRDIRRILPLLPAVRQNLLFSATFSDEIRTLAHTILKDPVTVEVARRNTPAELVTQAIYPVDRERKRDLLEKLIKEGDWHQVLVFMRTKHGANRLAEQLNKSGITAMPIHGNKSQSARERALSEFKAGSLRVLVATDIAARGIDIDALPHVVNYELPNVPEDYVHRIGRTGRAGAVGEALSLVCVDELKLMADIEKLMKRQLTRIVVPGFEPDLSIKPEPLRKPRTDLPPRSPRGPRKPSGDGGKPRASGQGSGRSGGGTGAGGGRAGGGAGSGSRPAGSGGKPAGSGGGNGNRSGGGGGGNSAPRPASKPRAPQEVNGNRAPSRGEPNGNRAPAGNGDGARRRKPATSGN
ncbi:MAG: DEAD/DEAH box helicase [Pseudomonadota bacterium]